MTRAGNRLILPGLALILLAVAGWMIFGSQPDRALTTPAQTPPTAPTAFAASVVAGAGVIEPSGELVTVGVIVPGLVTAVPVQAGDVVARGAVLFRLDDRDARAAVAERRAAVTYAARQAAVSRVELDAATRQLALYTAVEDPRAVAEQQVIDRRSQRDTAAARVALADADIARARAALASAETEVARRTIRAPSAGTVLQVRTRPGQYASAGDASLLTMGQVRPLHVRIDIDENEIPRLDPRAAAIISPRGDARRRVRATLVRVEPQVIPKRSLTNATNERVDVRVLQRIYALPMDATGFYVGQQVDAFVPGRRG